MMRFTSSHVIANPAGSFSVAGSLPTTCMRLTTPPSAAQAMAGRAFTKDGIRYGWESRPFQTRQEAEEAIKAGGGTLCDCCR